ncbi:MAG: ImmA/IrrE family metallo-endopeptidase [Thomasclavelia ramosa]
MILNNQDTDKHILFTLAHELAHYIFDYISDSSEEYSNSYRTNESQTDSELRANRFAASFLMPASSFSNTYKALLKDKKDKETIIKKLSDIFNVPETAVRIRIEELELDNE